jgi:hypothetical protein
MSQSIDLFSEGPQNRHPCALGLDELMKRFQRLILDLGLIFFVLALGGLFAAHWAT